MKSSEIRKRFLDFFQRNGHQIQPSAPLLPSDPDLLFNIAGMVPFKPYFLGEQEPPATRITTAQKCLRTEDIEQVGETARHLTFFEMLGNFSFGDYFKEEAIQLAWKFLVEELDLDPDRLWISVFGGDSEQDLKPDREAEEIWLGIDGVRPERVLHLGREENFWSMAETGPCGPCSEILYDQNSFDEDPENVKEMILQGRDRILELWNLVFMQFNRGEDGNLNELPDKNIDTGLGLERLTAVMQNAESNFDTDLFEPLMDKVNDLIEREFENRDERSNGRVIADHVRSSSFLLSEGLLPGNEGRGYVLRRLIRRAHLRGRHLGFREPFLSELVPTLVDIMGDHFEELRENQDEIQENLNREENQFERILSQGLNELEKQIENLKEKNESSMSGDRIFRLYETHGLPIEMTKDVLDEEGIDYDEEEIESAEEKHEQRSRDEETESGTDNFNFEGIPKTKFTGYDEMEREAMIVGLFKGDNRESVKSLTIEPTPTVESEVDPKANDKIILDATPFYAEGGGQSGDRGWIGDEIRVVNTTENNGRYVHSVERKKNASNDSLELSVGDTVHVQVDEQFRRGNMRHHTATHLLHHALRRELGEQVIQDGSALDDESLRFDFTYNEAVDQEKLNAIEDKINDWIYREIPVETRIMDRDEAEQEGALAFFGEHYGQQVRVVMMVDEDDTPSLDSKEFCGGTHLDNTGEIGVFTITNETAVASGVRRIEAKAGESAYQELRKKDRTLEQAANQAGIQQPEQLKRRINELQETVENQEKEIERLRQKQSAVEAKELLDEAEQIGDVRCITETFEKYDSDTLKKISDEIRNNSSSSAVLLANNNNGNVQLVVGIGDEISEQFDAGDISQELGSIIGGGGGGRPDFAEAGGSKPEAIPEAIEEFKSLISDVEA